MLNNEFVSNWWTKDGSRFFEELSDEKALQDVIETISVYSEKPNFETIQKAWLLAVDAHDNHVSKYSKRRVLRHILAVSKSVAEIGLDTDVVAAALLHDIVEDTDVTFKQIQDAFNERISKIVAAVSKYDNQKAIKSEAKHQRDYFKKLFDAISTDIDDLPAVFIKLAEKFDHMRFSIHHFPHEQQKDMANEILWGYAPLADRLGVYRLKAELEDLAFRTINFDDYFSISKEIQVQKENTDAFFRKAIPELRKLLDGAEISSTVSARRKHIYSTYEKMKRKGRKFVELQDFVGVRIIVNNIGDCYRTLQIVHSLWKPIPKELNDYIGLPKANGYQSLHTTVVSKEGFAIECQIRTQKMHEIAEFGLASHWRYKSSGDLESEALNAQFSVLHRQLEANKRIGNMEGYLRTISDDLLQDQIHVYLTENGELVTLPMQATPIDLAYAVDEELAPQVVGAKVGSFEVPLAWQLDSGDQVTLLRSQDQDSPEREWYTYVKTTLAKEGIKKYFQRFPKEINSREGMSVLQNELRIMGIETPLIDIASLMQYSDPEDLLGDIGACNVNARHVVEVLFKKPYEEDILRYWARETSRLSSVDSPARIVHCEYCNPELGRQISASYDRSIMTIHSSDCIKLVTGKKSKMLELPLLDPREIILTVYIRLKARDRRGLLNDITSLFSSELINVSNLHSSTDSYTNLVTINLEIDILSTVVMVDLLHQIKLIPSVESVLRMENPFEHKLKWKMDTALEDILSLDRVLLSTSMHNHNKPTGNKKKIESVTVNLQELRNLMNKAFSLEELEILCAETEYKMKLNQENINYSLDMFGVNRPKDNITFSMIQYLSRRGLLHYLLEEILAERPNVFGNLLQ